MNAGLSPSLNAQDQSEFIIGLGGGMSLYSISTRFDTGTIVRGSVGYSPIPWLVVETGARWHGCPDCDSFSILDGGLQLRLPGDRLSPFAAAGGGRSSDPEFMGSEWGLYAAVGGWLWLSGDGGGSSSRLAVGRLVLGPTWGRSPLEGRDGSVGRAGDPTPVAAPAWPGAGGS